MTWIYHRRTGEMFRDSELKASGYSGRMTNKNNPSRQHVKGLGPIPQGRYRITENTQTKGPLTLVLQPDESNNMFGRDLFRIHGERTYGPGGWASEGCIILPPSLRREIWRHRDEGLLVVP
jgi:hypothetical protein